MCLILPARRRCDAAAEEGGVLLEARQGGVAWGACVPVTPAEEEDGESDGGTLILNGVAMSTAALLPAALTTRRVLSGIDAELGSSWK